MDIQQPFVTQEQKYKFWVESKAEIKELRALLLDCKEQLLDANRNGYTRGFEVLAKINDLNLPRL
jgi:hypothetical protein